MHEKLNKIRQENPNFDRELVNSFAKNIPKIIDIKITIIPPKKSMAQRVVVYPGTSIPNIIVLISVTILYKNAKIDIKKPIPVTILSGVIEKLVIPSIAYLNNPQKLHFVEPRGLSTFS